MKPTTTQPDATAPSAEEAPRLHKARMVLCAACRQSVMDIDEARIGLTASYQNATGGRTTHRINFHRTCAEGVYRILGSKLSTQEEDEQ
jgi:hypothetical protein